MQPYELLARLLYLHGFMHADFLKALERGELPLESAGRFDPSAWLRVRPEGLPLSETAWSSEAIGGGGVRIASGSVYFFISCRGSGIGW